MLAYQVEVSGEHARRECASVVNSRLEGVVRAEQAKGRRGSEDLGVGSRGLAGGGIALVINDRAVSVFDQNSPGISGDGGPGENGVNLVRNGLRVAGQEGNKQDGQPKSPSDISHARSGLARGCYHISKLRLRQLRRASHP